MLKTAEFTASSSGLSSQGLVLDVANTLRAPDSSSIEITPIGSTIPSIPTADLLGEESFSESISEIPHFETFVISASDKSALTLSEVDTENLTLDPSVLADPDFTSLTLDGIEATPEAYSFFDDADLDYGQVLNSYNATTFDPNTFCF